MLFVVHRTAQPFDYFNSTEEEWSHKSLEVEITGMVCHISLSFTGGQSKNKGKGIQITYILYKPIDIFLLYGNICLNIYSSYNQFSGSEMVFADPSPALSLISAPDPDLTCFQNGIQTNSLSFIYLTRCLCPLHEN